MGLPEVIAAAGPHPEVVVLSPEPVLAGVEVVHVPLPLADLVDGVELAPGRGVVGIQPQRPGLQLVGRYVVGLYEPLPEFAVKVHE